MDNSDAVEEVGHAGAVDAEEAFDAHGECATVHREDPGAQVVPVPVQRSVSEDEGVFALISGGAEYF